MKIKITWVSGSSLATNTIDTDKAFPDFCAAANAQGGVFVNDGLFVVIHAIVCFEVSQ